MSAAGRIGAFFDLDGTLLAPPSLEWRFLAHLLASDELETANVARWFAHFAKRLASHPRGAASGNKHYLAGIRESVAEEWASAIAPDSLPLFDEGIDRVHWHLERRHRVVLVTGTLAPLARAIARQLPCGVEVRATELEVIDGRFTGRILGAHVSFGEKARAVREEAVAHDLDLEQSFAYGNEMSDARMLEAVGHPAAVNGSWRLALAARMNGWAQYSWAESRVALVRARGGAISARAAR